MDSERTAPGRGSVAPRARSGPFRSLRMILIGADPPPPPARSTWLARALPILGVGTSIATVFIAAANYDDRYARPLLLWPASVLIGLPLALIRRWPLLAWRIAWLTAVIIGAVFRVNRSLPWPWQHIQLIVFPVLLYAVAVRHSRGVVVGVGIFTITLIAADVRVPNSVGLMIAVVAVLILGDQVRRRRDAQRELVAQEEVSAQEQARAAVLQERTRIAREMHDVVAHHMSLIAVRAETASYRVADLPPGAADEFVGIADGAREALTEMRRLLGVLRSGSPDLELAPQPGLADLDGVVDASRRAGVDVRMSWAGVPATVPSVVGLSAYRIVQEALSNASRHAPGAAVTIDLRGGGFALWATLPLSGERSR